MTYNFRHTKKERNLSRGKMENSNKELKCVQMKILELKNTVTEIKNLLNRFNVEEDKIIELETGS